MWEIAFEAGFDAYQCPRCGQAITKEKFESTFKKEEKQPPKRWWSFKWWGFKK